MRNAADRSRWGTDVVESVELYNRWYMNFAPRVYESVREEVERDVRHAMDVTDLFRNLTGRRLRANPGILGVLRMCTSPPLAVDRVRGLAAMGISVNTINVMESENAMPTMMSRQEEIDTAEALVAVVERMLDHDLFCWLKSGSEPAESDIRRASTVIAERFSASKVNPILRNAQEQRQLDVIETWLQERGYDRRRPPTGTELRLMKSGTYAFRFNVEAGKEGETNIPVDVAVQPHSPRSSGLPVLIEAKSAGDFTNVNKRRKEEATKASQLRQRYGNEIQYVLFLGGYFDEGYLAYEARHDIDWVWEHRVEDFVDFGL